jgi:hypothetical protein
MTAFHPTSPFARALLLFGERDIEVEVEVAAK